MKDKTTNLEYLKMTNFIAFYYSLLKTNIKSILETITLIFKSLFIRSLLS